MAEKDDAIRSAERALAVRFPGDYTSWLRDNDGLEGWAVLKEPSELIKGADAFELRATDAGLRPPPPSSVEPSGIPTMPTDDPGPIDEAIGGITLPMAADPPATELPIPVGATVIELPMAAGGGEKAVCF